MVFSSQNNGIGVYQSFTTSLRTPLGLMSLSSSLDWRKRGSFMLRTERSLAAHIFAVNRRKNERGDVVLHTHLMLPGRQLMQIEIGNISQGGMLALLPQPMAEGGTARVELPGIGWLQSKVVWALNDTYGFAFDEAISNHMTDVLRFVYRQMD
jgi:hypothetical protein